MKLIHVLPLVMLAAALPVWSDEIPDDLQGTSKNWAHIKNNPYFKDRATKTVVLQNDNLSIGVSKDFGGAIFEFFGKNRHWDHNLMQMSDGGGMQLSIWGKDASASPKALWFGGATPNLAGTTGPHGLRDLKGCATKEECASAGNTNPKSEGFGEGKQVCVAPDYPILGFSAGGPWNPLQAFYNVHVGLNDPTNDVVESKQEGNAVYMRQENPWQFTKTSRVDGIVFEEWVTLHDAYAEIKYAVSYKGPSRWTRAPQEMPAIFTGYSMNDHGFYYDGNKPFTDDTDVVRMGHEKRFLKLPPPPENNGKYMRAEEAYKGHICEGWWSTCNQPEDMCMTVACFSELMESVDFNLNKIDGHGYATPQSAIAVDPTKAYTWTVYLFPDKYDVKVADKTVREWICEIAPADYKARVTTN